MLSILSLVLVMVLSLLITRVATIALTHTGLSKESARFQARSALTGAGFTTAESENVVEHPVRRRIVALLMLLGNAGLVTAVTSLLLTFVGNDQEDSPGLGLKLGVLFVAVLVLWLVARSAWVDRHLSRWIDDLLRRHTSLDVRDYASLLQLEAGYRLAELEVQPKGWLAERWLAERSLAELALRDEGVLVLGIRRTDGEYLGAPRGDTLLHAGDALFVYGREDSLSAVDERRRGFLGDVEHERAVSEQQRIAAEETERAG